MYSTEAKWDLAQVQAQPPPREIDHASRSDAHNSHEAIETRNGSENAHALHRQQRLRKANESGIVSSSVVLESRNGYMGYMIGIGFVNGSGTFARHNRTGCGCDSNFDREDIRVRIEIY